MNPYVLGHEEGEAIRMFDALDTIKADAERTGRGLTVVESTRNLGREKCACPARPDALAQCSVTSKAARSK
jgi:hypothetical protein